MSVIIKRFDGYPSNSMFRIVPLGDIHLGAAACDEKRLKEDIAQIASEENTYWIGMGDYAEFINRKDPRFDYGSLAPWLITKSSLGDLAKAQSNKFLELFDPIAHKCLAMVEGNHESVIQRHYERNIFSEMVTGIKEAGKFDPEERLGLGFTGWLVLKFTRGVSKGKKMGGQSLTFNLHHGFVGGRLAGAKALNMQRWLWTHGADIVMFGHSHNTMIQVEQVESLNKSGKVVGTRRIGMYGGSYLMAHNPDGHGSTYSEVKGYFPTPSIGTEVFIKPFLKNAERRFWASVRV